VKYQNQKRVIIMNSNRVTGVSVTLLILFPFLFYLHVPFITGLQYLQKPSTINTTMSACGVYHEWFEFSLRLSILDIVLTVLVPFVVILTFNILIFIELKKIAAKRKQMSVRGRMFTVATRNLITLSLCFVFFNSLMTYSKLDSLFWADLNLDQQQTNGTIGEPSHTSTAGEDNLNTKIVDKLAFNLYYLNFSLNFFLYVLNGPEFRNTLFLVIRKKLTIRRNITSSVVKL
jgi:hypothetical protein